LAPASDAPAPGAGILDHGRDAPDALRDQLLSVPDVGPAPLVQLGGGGRNGGSDGLDVRISESRSSDKPDLRNDAGTDQLERVAADESRHARLVAVGGFARCGFPGALVAIGIVVGWNFWWEWVR